MKKNFSFLQLKKLLFQPFCSFFAIAFFGLLLVGLILVFANKKQILFSQSSELQNSAIQSDLPQTSRKKRANSEGSEEATTECHITRHDAVYKNLWTHLFKTVFPWLKRAKIKKVWVMTDVSVQPYIHKQFDVSAFDYHGVGKYRNWNAIPAQEKCAWFNKYPNQPRENPWLSSPFASLRGLMFYLGFLKGYHHLYKRWRVTQLFHNFLDVGYFLTLSDQQIFKSLTTRKFTLGLEHQGDQKNFLYVLGLFFLAYPNKYSTGPVIEVNLSGGNFVTKMHSNKQKMLSASYDWQKFDWRAWHMIKNTINRDSKLLDIYYYLRPLLWELDHYQIDMIKNISVSNLVQESKTVVNFYLLSGKAKKEYRQLINIFPSGGSSASNFSKFKQFFQLPLTAAKNKFFWKVIAPFLSKLKQYKVLLWKGVALKPLLAEAPSQTFANLKKPAQTVITDLVQKFYLPIANPFQKIASLEKLHQYDNYQEMIKLHEELNNLFITESDAQFCAALTDLRYQKWWEEIFQPLVPKLVEHKVTQVYYGVKRAIRHKTGKWKLDDALNFDQLFFNVALHNYYGAREYQNYQEVPNEIKCQLPSFLFQPKRGKTLKSLKVYSDLFLSKLTQYQKHPLNWENKTFFYSSYELDPRPLLLKTEGDIFALIQEMPTEKEISRNVFIWSLEQWQLTFIYLGVLDISSKIKADYQQKITDYFTNSQFWLDIRSYWKNLRSDQFFTSWKGNVVTSLKQHADIPSYQQLPVNEQTLLKTLLQTASPHLLVTQIRTLTDHLSQLDALWKELQTLQPDLEKYQMKQLQAVDFTNLRTHLTVANPRELPSQAKTELLNLMEISDLIEQFKQGLIWLRTRSAWQKIANDQLLTTWRGYDVTGLKKEANFAFHHQLNSANQIVLKNLMKTGSADLLTAQITTLTTQLANLDVLWKELQSLRFDLEKYSINQLEEVEFNNLKTHLAIPDPTKLPPQAKTELLSLMEIDDFVVKLKENLRPFQAADAEKTTDNQTLIIVLSTILPLIVFGLVGGAFFYFKKKSKAGSPNSKK